MAEQLMVADSTDRAERYRMLIPQLIALTAGEPDAIANMANVVSALKTTFGWFWVGFYRVVGDDLVLGPFQGSLACTRIAPGKGVCGAARAQRATLVVPDVDAFPGHIACASESRSEIVVPVIVDSEVVAVLDVDSDRPDDFDDTDVHGLEALIAALGGRLA